LLDTYDTLAGARRAVAAARELAARGGRLGGVRLDSGDLGSLSREVRSVLDEAGLAGVAIFASGNLDEFAIAALLDAGAPIDGFGVGTRMGVSADAPAIDTAYKLVALDGRPVMKLSPGKRTLPGAKQVWRLRSGERFAGDVVGLADEAGPPGAEPLLATVMEAGVAVPAEPLAVTRARVAAQRAALAERHRRLDADPYPVETSPALAGLAAAVGRELAARGA
jgi:nicotinate phosphoribosyltransferase